MRPLLFTNLSLLRSTLDASLHSNDLFFFFWHSCVSAQHFTRSRPFLFVVSFWRSRFLFRFSLWHSVLFCFDVFGCLVPGGVRWFWLWERMCPYAVWPRMQGPMRVSVEDEGTYIPRIKDACSETTRRVALVPPIGLPHPSHVVEARYAASPLSQQD